MEDIYNKVYARVNSSAVLKDFKDNDKVTPLVALAVVAGGVELNTKEELIALLEKFNIPVKPEASILELYDAVYNELKITRVADEVATDYMDQIYEQALDFVHRAEAEEPNIVEYYEDYLGIKQELIAQDELRNLNIGESSGYTKADLNSAKNLFERACQRANIRPEKFIGAYNNLTGLSEVTESMYADESLLTEFTRQLSIYKGNYIALNEFFSTNGREEILALIKKYSIEFSKSQKSYLEQSQRLEELMGQLAYNDDPLFCKQISRFQNQVEDLNLKYLEDNAKVDIMDALATNKPFRRFTRSGALFLSVLALFDVAQYLVKVSNIKSYSNNANRQELALQEAVEENKDNLFVFLEKLPRKAQNSAFAYISEGYFEDFQNQTKNLLFALALLENPSLNSYKGTVTQQEIDGQFDKSYRRAEKKYTKTL